MESNPGRKGEVIRGVQLADGADVVVGLKGRGARISALVPNAKGCEAALRAGVDAVTVFLSASESHNLKNLNKPVADSIAGVPDIKAIVGNTELTVAISTSFGCPFEGDVPPENLARIVEKLGGFGCGRFSLGDTTGMATPPVVAALYTTLTERFPELEFIMHFHNTRGLGLVNVMTSLQLGVTRFESSIGGLGGCPFAPGATGNVATEDLIHMLDELGVENGVDLDTLLATAHKLELCLDHPLDSALSRAGKRLRCFDCGVVATAHGRG